MQDIKQIQEDIKNLKQNNLDARADKDVTINDFMYLTSRAIRIIDDLQKTQSEISKLLGYE